MRFLIFIYLLCTLLLAFSPAFGWLSETEVISILICIMTPCGVLAVIGIIMYWTQAENPNQEKIRDLEEKNKSKLRSLQYIKDKTAIKKIKRNIRKRLRKIERIKNGD